MVRQIFKGRVLATAGPLPGQLNVDDLKRWTAIRKGVFLEDLDDTVTHLLCTRDQFKKKVPRVKEALKRGKRLHIIHYDWFESSTFKEKRQPERQYSMRSIIAKQNAKRREEARIQRGIDNGTKFVNTNLFHIYIDRDFFPYQIDITREDEATGEVGQRYTLCLWESDAKPHLYQFTAKFLKKKGSSQPSYYRPSPCSDKWRTEMDLFVEFFRIKTGIEWEDRVVKEQTMSSSYFQYAPPRGGKPVGRRLRFEYEYCRQINAELRGLPWPPPEQVVPEVEEIAGDGPILADGNEVVSEEVFGDGNATEDGQHHENGDVDTDMDEELQSSQESSIQGENVIQEEDSVEDENSIQEKNSLQEDESAQENSIQEQCVQENTIREGSNDSQISESGTSLPSTLLTEFVCSTPSNSRDIYKDAKLEDRDGDLGITKCVGFDAPTAAPSEKAQESGKTDSPVPEGHIRERTHHQVVESC